MADASSIRAGGAHVEISSDDAPMMRNLRQTQGRLRQWVAENSGAMQINRGTEGAIGGDSKGFLGGGFRGMELFNTGMRFATAIAAVKVAMKDVAIASAMVRGDWEGMRKAAESLPFGLGEIVKELSGPVDAAFAAIVNRVKGIWESPYSQAAIDKAKRDRVEEAAQHNRFLKAFSPVDDALKKASMSAREYAKAEVDAMNLGTAEAEKLLAAKLRLIDLDESKDASKKRQAEAERSQHLITQAMEEHAKLTMTEEQFVAYEVRNLNLAADAAQSLVSWRLENLRVTKEQKKADEDAKKVADDRRKAEREAEEWRRVGEEAAWEVRQEFSHMAAAIEESVATPEEKLREQLGAIEDLSRRGLFGSPETRKRAIKQALEEAARAMPDVAARTEVRSLTGAFGAQYMAVGSAGDPKLLEAKKHTELLQEIARKVGIDPGIVVQ